MQINYEKIKIKLAKIGATMIEKSANLCIHNDLFKAP